MEGSRRGRVLRGYGHGCQILFFITEVAKMDSI